MNATEFHRWIASDRPRPLVMGILNVTPDSFSDGGTFLDPNAAAEHARRLIDEGADLVDVGGESTRPGARRVNAPGQIARIAPVIEAIRRFSDIAISVDTTLSEVAAVAIEAGATLLNDISAAREDPAMLELAAEHALPIILMHMQGEPGTMQEQPFYDDVTAEVTDFLRERSFAAAAAGIAPPRILLDPGIGFGKTVEHNLTLLRNLPALQRLGHHLVVGVSRKRFIGAITGVEDPAERIYGSIAAALESIARGAMILRVHDVAPTVQAIKMHLAIRA